MKSGANLCNDRWLKLRSPEPAYTAIDETSVSNLFSAAFFLATSLNLSGICSGGTQAEQLSVSNRCRLMESTDGRHSLKLITFASMTSCNDYLQLTPSESYRKSSGFRVALNDDNKVPKEKATLPGLLISQRGLLRIVIHGACIRGGNQSKSSSQT